MSRVHSIVLCRLILLFSFLGLSISVPDLGIQKDLIQNRQTYSNLVWSYSAIVEFTWHKDYLSNDLSDLSDGQFMNLVKRAAEAMEADIERRDPQKRGPTVMVGIAIDQVLYLASSTFNSQQVFQSGPEDLSWAARLMRNCQRNVHRRNAACGEFNCLSLAGHYKPTLRQEADLELATIGRIGAYSWEARSVFPPCSDRAWTYGCRTWLETFTPNLRPMEGNVQPDATNEDYLTFWHVQNPRADGQACPVGPAQR